MKCYWMLQNARITAFTVAELLRENQHGKGGGDKITPHPFQIRAMIEISWENCKRSVIDVWMGSKYFSVQC